MTYEFIQVTARKDNGDFALCSNLSLMDCEGLTPKQAVRKLQVMADSYQLNGYSIEWTREVMGADEVEFWGPLFDKAAA
jgi:hypothetical protein